MTTISTLASKVVARFHRDGALAASRYYASVVKHAAHYLAYDRRWDRLEQVRTSGAILVPETDVVGRTDRLEDRRYQAAARLPVTWAISALRVDPAQYTFVDYGSGRGRVLLTAARFPFKKVIGVEFSRTLHRQACENIAGYPKERLDCSEVVSLNLNAVDFDLPSGDCVLFFLNPFGGETLDRVTDRIERSWLDSPRSILVAFANSNRVPLFVHRRLFQRLRPTIPDRLRVNFLSPWPFEFFAVRGR